MRIEPGLVLADRYEIAEPIGSGGMGVVFRAHDRRLDREVAVKVLLPRLADDADAVRRFEREARALARVDHQGIIEVYDLLPVQQDTVALILEYAPGLSLEGLLAAGPLPWDECADIGAQVCDALTAAHERGIVHRDIKPSNILIRPDGAVRVADFGIARLVTEGHSRGSQTMGTPGFVAPEQAHGEAAGPSSDIYSLGVVLYRAATGVNPFRSEDGELAEALMHVVRPVPDPADDAPSLPPTARGIIMRALAKDPAERFASAGQMAAALRDSASGPARLTVPEGPHAGEAADDPTETDAGVAPAGPATVATADGPTRTVAGVRRRRAGLLAAGVVAAGIAAVAGITAAGGFADDDPPAPERVAAGDGTLEVPAGWAHGQGGAIPGMEVTGAVTAFPQGSDGGLVAGRIAGAGPTLLPAAYRARLGGPVPEPRPVRLRDLEAYRYEGLPSGRGADDLVLFVVPTTGGVQAVACTPGARPVILADCEAAAASLELSGAEPVPLGPQRAVAARLDAVLGRLERRRAVLRRRLAEAGTAEEQAAVAEDLAAAHRTAAAGLRSVGTGPEIAPLRRGLVAALREAGTAYSDLAGAAAVIDADAYAEAVGAVDAAERRIGAATRALAGAGYELG